MADALLARTPPTPGLRDPGDRPGAGAQLRRGAEWSLLGAFAAYLAILVPRHEPWFDEAQAWLIARDIGLAELVWERLRFEGSPGLWHLLLLVPARLGAPYAALGVVGALAAFAGAVLLVRRGPFPLVVKAALLASFHLGYQYAVVARSYDLVPPLLFAAALAWPRRVERPLRLALALGLLAATSVHGTLIAGCLAAVHLGAVVRRWRDLDPATRWRNAGALAGLAALAVAIVVLLWPPAEQFLGEGWNLDPRHVARSVPGLLDAAFTDLPALTAVVLVVSGVVFARAGTLHLWALPTAALLLLAAVKYHMPWHQGLPFVVWVFTLWVTLQAGQPRWARLAACAALAAVLVVQVPWWIGSVRYDLTEPYAGGRELGAYLAALPDDAVVYAQGYHFVAALPYLDDNPIANYQGGRMPAPWTWTPTPPLVLEPAEVFGGVPDVFVYGVKQPGSLPPPDLPGYRLAREIDGALTFKGRVIEPDAFLIFERAEGSAG